MESSSFEAFVENLLGNTAPRLTYVSWGARETSQTLQILRLQTRH